MCLCTLVVRDLLLWVICPMRHTGLCRRCARWGKPVYHLICCRRLTSPQPEHLPYDHVAHGLELLLFGERQPLWQVLRVGPVDRLPHLIPEIIGFCHSLISSQRIHDPIHHQLHLRRQVAVDLFPSDRPQAPRQGLYLIFQLRVLQGPIPHLPDQFLHGLRGILLQLVAVRCLLLIDMHQVLLEDPSGEGGLHLPDAVRGEVAFFGIGGEYYHVDMDALLFFMEGGVPPQVIRMDLVAFGDVAKAGVYQGAPILRVVVAQPLRVLLQNCLVVQFRLLLPQIVQILHHCPVQLHHLCDQSILLTGVERIAVSGDPQLNPGLTFATFIEGECNRLARSAGMSVAVNPGNNPFNPLYIYGDSGLGKTHIVQSIGHEVRQRHPELQVLYVSMNKFQAQFQTAYKNGEIPDFIHFYQMIDVLIIDDIQELTGKTGTQNAFFNIFNHLQLAGKQLILTSDKPPVELKDIEQRLLTRFKWGLSAQLNTPDYDTKLKIIRAKAQKLGAQITDDVVAYLADNISANVREIEGALSSLVANASFLGRKITTSLAKEILKVYVKLYQKEITIDHIIEVVCEYLNLDFARFNSTERTREIAQARQIAMYLAKQHTKAPLTTIGSAIGGRNHATVLHSCKAVTNLIETDKAFRRQVEEIEKKVLAQ